MFLQVCVILFTGGEYLTRYIPRDQVHSPGPGTPPWTRYTPQDQVHPPGPGTPPGAQHAGRYGLCAGSTHPTGMRSCSGCCCGLMIQTQRGIIQTITYNTVADPTFPRALTICGHEKLLFGQFFSRKLHENERNWTTKWTCVPAILFPYPAKIHQSHLYTRTSY